MSTLLVVNSSPFHETSVSRHLSEEFVQNWKQANPNGRVITRDLTSSDLKTVDAAWVGAAYTPKDARTAEQKQALEVSDTLLGELRAADEYVFGVPMHNFGIPSLLKLWIDQIARVGETFSYSEAGPKGLLQGKKATFLIASGGAYDAGTVMASFNHVEPYLRSVFGFIGVTDTKFLSAGGASAVMSGQVDRATFLKPHVEAIRSQFVAA
ncbi:FMN-dependent NADH-azoreductase [Tunturiibacter gelidoferens]|uniref:FMN dependent NADH:quinone oxidoreductase n=2 Tax=Tunturiibacter TaxID=3154218 RepID=A0A7Y9TBR7_9BACT|nr:NAD(P)H-dependent oxidoreductase [Edaphobacter lichenicola]MBB5341637.1 FMN-dependent NADH-azoreductase [Edaphobacter lichenicola]NYF53385.1 FMN-dependent NADH-azoreductase [Edaphobacter lichenicola]